MNFAINIEPLYPGLDICEKIERVSTAGFNGIEFWSWHDRDVEKIKETCKRFGVKINAFSGTKEWSLCDRTTRVEYLDWIEKSIQTAKEFDCNNLILFPNHFTPAGCSDFRDRYSQEAMIANVTATLCEMLPLLERENMRVLLEPLCNVGADAGMSVTTTEQGAAIVRAVNSEAVGLLCDVYHMQMMHGDLVNNLISNMDIVPYIHIADAPDRHEPGSGEINFDFICKRLLEEKYEGTICMEYFPAGDTDQGFTAVKEFINKFS